MANEAFKKEEFLRRKKEAFSDIDMAAQQLTNIYRQLSVLGDEATERFNQQLLRDANPEVLAALKTIPGGEEVRDYYHFLTHTDFDSADSVFDKSPEDAIDAMLPKPDQISPVWETFGISNVQGGAGDRQKPIQMSVVNPIRASVITSSVGGAADPLGAGSFVPQQSPVDFDALQNDINEAYEKQKAEIIQSLNFIVIDSNIEKMHQNLKTATNTIMECLDQLKADLDKIIGDASENAAFPDIDDLAEDAELPAPEVLPTPIEPQEAEEVVHEKTRRPKMEPKFSVDTTDIED
ncbi:MAG: hypothetical protein J6P93_04365 [Alphaproteobacteria bacterium]|nr:hypothetical protein [Alphaproteobacteria bacterium]